VGARFAELAAELRGSPAATAPETAIVLDDVDAEGRPLPDSRRACAPGGAFSLAWLAAAEQLGRGPQVVLRSRSADPAALRARGIHRLIDEPFAVAHTES